VAVTTSTSHFLVLWVIFGATVVGLSVLALLTWVGSARAAYIRGYNKVHSAKLPAGVLEEWIEDGNAKQDREFFDLFGSKRRARKQRIWAAMEEPQDDPELEALRTQALLRSRRVVWLAPLAYVAAGFVWLWSVLHR